MIDQSKTEKQMDRAAWIYGLMIFLTLVGPLFAAIAWKDKVANECSGMDATRELLIVEGRISELSKPLAYYISTTEKNHLLVGCTGKGGCTGPNPSKLRQSIGKTAVAAFCSTELLWVDVEGKRVISIDRTGRNFWETALIFGLGLLIVAVVGYANYLDREHAKQPNAEM